MLCSQCQTIVPAIHDEYSHSCLTRHHVTFQDLIRSADEGCELCQVFRPSVERVMQSRDDVTYPNRGYGWNDTDPFKDFSPKQQYVVMGDEDEKYGSKVYYVDYGTHFELHTLNEGKKEHDFKVRKKAQIKDESSDFENETTNKINPWDSIQRSQERDWLQNHYLDNHEIFQWLFLTSGLVRTGPEQLWIDRRYHAGCANDRGIVSAGQRESISSFKLTAGSVCLPRYGGDFCYQDRHVGGLQQLAVLFPGLWKWPCRFLGDFEFYNTSGASRRAAQPWRDIVTRSLQPHANSPESFAILQRWLSDCRNNHSHCGTSPVTDTVPPPRLINVGSPDGSQNPYLQVLDDEEILPYTTLSHCGDWPNMESGGFFKLSTYNYESSQLRIRLGELTRNLQDAIVTTRALSISHLWVDVLCIIQDSPEDRAKEASKKEQYFANAELNIAATASPNPQHGILNSRDLALHSVSLTGDADGLGVRPLAEDVFSLVKEPWLLQERSSISVKPLSLQGHAFLERITSKRTVHFTEQQMIWQCQTCLVGEDGQIGEDRDRFERLCSKRPFDIHLGLPMRQITGTNENEHCRDPDIALSSPVEGYTGVKYSLDEALMDTKWYGLLEEYTQRSVYEASDRLPLLSHFAKQIHGRTNASYLAGLWAIEGQIPFRSLLWYCKGKGATANNGSPSWTWSSVVGAITHPAQDMHRMDHPGARCEWLPPRAQSQRLVISYPYMDSQIQILSAETRPTTADIYGKVEGGEIRITGLVHSYAGAHEWDFSAERGHSRQIDISHSPDLPEGEVVSSRKTFFLKEQTDAEKVDDTAKNNKDEHNENQEEMQFTLTEYLDTINPSDVQWKTEKHLLLLVAEFRDELDSSCKPCITPSDSIEFIILRYHASRDETTDCYTRIGTAKLQRKNREKGMIAPAGLWGVHSAYTAENGWNRKTLILV